ncbi:MAG TPA: RusA family crossover junction endodeoxyribonuclease [Clostridiales bacterium]|nr:RusA family crossover junction endodeoxyribonuclease [Clostridiales bacterium]
MAKALELTSPIPPSVNHYLGWRAVMRGNKPIVMSYTTSEAKKYKKAFTNYVIEQAKQQGWNISDNRFQHYYIDTTFYFPRIDMDCNNYWKCLFDSISESKCVWLDDTQACERVKGIYYDTANPRLELTIYPVDYIGIFDNRTQLDEFETNCFQCTRYRNGKCSILTKVKEGRIQKEVINKCCSQYKLKK